jgi:homoserine kinase
MLNDAAVRIPASTSNLGSGFDTLGLAVRRYLTARYEPGEGELSLTRDGTLTELYVSSEDDLLWRAFRAELARRGVARATGSLYVKSEIPVGRGLGTSAAATVAGLLLAATATGDTAPDREALLDHAAALEGHGDNAAPQLFGGLVAVAPRLSGGVRALPLPLSSELAFAFAAPTVRVATAEARKALPSQYPKSTAISALGRLAALLHGLAHGDGDALAVGFTDELHVPYRLPLIQGGAAALDAARDAGAWGATISGSGSGLIAVCPRERLGQVGSAMVAAFRHAGHEEIVTFPLDPEPDGAEVLRPAGARADVGAET